MIRSSFFTGLALLLPVALTLLIINFVVNLLTDPFMGIFQSALASLGLTESSIGKWWQSIILLGVSKLSILLLLAVFIAAIGIFFARLFLIKYLLHPAEILIHKIPLVNKLYKGFRDGVQNVFNKKEASFSEVVLVPFPGKNSLSLGLVTGKTTTRTCAEEPATTTIAVFVPGSPNPTVGYMLMFTRDQIIPLEMKVEDAMKFIISGGALLNLETAIKRG